MRRLDHTMIFVLIAGTYTPFALLVLHGTVARIVLIAVWVCAGAGTVLNLIWWNAPKTVTAAVYISTGWIAVLAFPQLWSGLGPVGFGLIVLGGILYTAGAVVYARRRPDPRPAVFGYHEIFHLLVIAAAACDFAAIAVYALPAG
jgi:hemolysin III